MTQEGHILVLEKKAEVLKHSPKRKRRDVIPSLPHCSETDTDPFPLVIQDSTHKLSLLINPSVSVNPMFHKPALSPSHPIGLTSFHGKVLIQKLLMALC